MYISASFYNPENLVDGQGNSVLGARTVSAGENYRADMTKDKLSEEENIFCFIRTMVGGGAVETKSQNYSLEKDSFITLRRSEITAVYSACKNWSYLWIDFISYSPEQTFAGQKHILAFSEREQNIVGEMLETGINFPEETDYIRSIFLHYRSFLLFGIAHGNKKKGNSSLFAEICGYIQKKIYTKLTVAEIADLFYLSPRRLHQIFVENIGMSPKKYISTQKTLKAKSLLESTSLSVSDIADALCYDSAYHFSSAFKAAEGCSPSEYRKKI